MNWFGSYGSINENLTKFSLIEIMITPRFSKIEFTSDLLRALFYFYNAVLYGVIPFNNGLFDGNIDVIRLGFDKLKHVEKLTRFELVDF